MSELHEALRALGATADEVDAAERNGTLFALAAERYLLPGERSLDAVDVAARCGVELETLAKLYLALGFPRAADEKLFTDQDVDVLQTFLRNGSVTDYSLHEVRAISASLGRIADVFVDEIWDAHRSAGQSDREALSAMADGIDLERLERILMYLLRKHLVAGVYRRSALHDQAMRDGAPSMAVGFADLAGFATLSQAMSAAELASLLVGFERTAYDVVVELDGRVVKTRRRAVHRGDAGRGRRGGAPVGRSRERAAACARRSGLGPGLDSPRRLLRTHREPRQPLGRLRRRRRGRHRPCDGW